MTGAYADFGGKISRLDLPKTFSVGVGSLISTIQSAVFRVPQEEAVF